MRMHWCIRAASPDVDDETLSKMASVEMGSEFRSVARDILTAVRGLSGGMDFHILQACAEYEQTLNLKKEDYAQNLNH